MHLSTIEAAIKTRRLPLTEFKNAAAQIVDYERQQDYNRVVSLDVVEKLVAVARAAKSLVHDFHYGMDGIRNARIRLEEALKDLEEL